MAVLPEMVLSTFPERLFIITHPLPADLGHAPNLLVWRKGTNSPNVNSLLEVLMAGRNKDTTLRERKGRHKRSLNA